MSTIEVVGLGALNVDYLYRVKEVIVEGERVVEDFKLLPGGSAANTIYGLAKLGMGTGFVGVVGDDENGKLLLQDFEIVGVDTSQIRFKPEAKTGSVLCVSDKQGRRALYVSPGANSLLALADMNIAYLNQAKIVHLSSFVDNEQFRVQVKLVKQMPTSVKVSLTPGMLYAARGLEALTPLLERTHILFLNQMEIERLTGRHFRDGAQDCLKRGCQIVVVTLGQGLALDEVTTITAYICNNKEEYNIKPKERGLKSELETTGAGDAFAAGFLFGFLKGKGLEECGLLGDIVARCAISKMGARTGLPSLAQLSQRYFQYTGQQL